MAKEYIVTSSDSKIGIDEFRQQPVTESGKFFGVKSDGNVDLIAGAGGMTAQMVYDIVYPTGYEYLGFSAPVVPDGVTATWTEDTTYNGRYLKIDSDQSAKTLETEQIPKPYITSSGNHYHSIGESGAHKHKIQNGWSPQSLRFDEANVYHSNNAASWAGETQFDGAHSHSMSTTGSHVHGVEDGGIYVDTGALRPLTVTIKMFVRSA